MTGTFAIPGVPDATGRHVRSLPDALEDAVRLSPNWHARQNEMLLRVPDVGTFRVTDGTTIEVAAGPSVTQHQLDSYLSGAVRAALIQQRGELALHATTVVPPDAGFAVALCGSAVTGKSTLAAELCRRGWRLLADDLTRVQCSGGSAVAWPSDTTVKLWKDACDTLAIPVVGLQRVRPDVERYVVPLAAHADVLPLRLILQLRTRESGVERTVPAIDRMVLLNQYVFRRRQIAALGMSQRHGANIMQLAAAASVGTLRGSRTQALASNADRVEEALTWIRP